eukprot:SAG11_NODE_14991_length_592_cov_0.831643_1_plen_63_part_00
MPDLVSTSTKFSTAVDSTGITRMCSGLISIQQQPLVPTTVLQPVVGTTFPRRTTSSRYMYMY